MKYSIVIPTYNHLETCLIPCINSIVKNTILDDVELIIVSNGSNDGTNEYLFNLKKDIKNLNIIIYDEPIGYPAAINAGIKQAKGDFIIPFNNDCQILDFAEKNEWIIRLNKPFEDNKVGITGIRELFCKEANHTFLVFFLVMIRKKMLDEIGLLDEIFGIGSSEDIDICLRAVKNGWKFINIINDPNTSYVTDFPVYHKAEATVHGISGWEEHYEKNLKIIKYRVDSFQYEEFADVTAYVSTKGRYTTTLPACLCAIANQTLKPKKIIIFQDDHLKFNMQESSIYKNILYGLFKQKGIEWSVIFGKDKGQVLNHQQALDIVTTKWIWRIDDDNFPESNVLEGLCKHIHEKLGAVASAIIDPLYNPSNIFSSGKIEHINISPNLQWTKSNKIIPVEHLYSSFLFRKEAGIHGYNKELSPVGHREETLFTHEMYRKGWELLIDTNLVTHHFKEPVGGIRSYNNPLLFNDDENIFKKKLLEWDIKLAETNVINFNSGRGDHWMLKKSLEKIVKQSNDIIFCACCYPEILEDLKEKYNNLILISIEEGNYMFGKEMEEKNIYKFCANVNWKQHIEKAFETLFKIIK